MNQYMAQVSQAKRSVLIVRLLFLVTFTTSSVLLLPFIEVRNSAALALAVPLVLSSRFVRSAPTQSSGDPGIYKTIDGGSNWSVVGNAQPATTFTVTNTNDNGAGSLPQDILEAKGNEGA